ncbi:similar to RIKEN cDNA 1110038F21 (predicted), isoform CRA_c [Rattus norvegicus]|uniref:Uncharacterized protein n=1 Tax=Rattus norvegicus TaxID=10116 RepID=A6K2Q2_RAT|nr:similar to RIKEN cDNA 1110038F21 (predicted), isoform CRA_c [Rattus norvegicus]
MPSPLVFSFSYNWKKNSPGSSDSALTLMTQQPHNKGSPGIRGQTRAFYSWNQNRPQARDSSAVKNTGCHLIPSTNMVVHSHLVTPVQRNPKPSLGLHGLPGMHTVVPYMQTKHPYT